MSFKILVLSVITFLLVGCKKDKIEESIDQSVLSGYLEVNSDLEAANLISCAGGNNTSFMGSSETPISVFFYLESGASEFKYFETDSIEVDNADLSIYKEKDYSLTSLFNGVMMKFNHPVVNREKWGVVTFKTNGKLHKCNPIRIKAGVSPTQDISTQVVVTENGITPNFDWTAEDEPNNVIYFSIVSDLSENLISGTYTYDKFWTFYDLSNVVLNVSPVNPMINLNQDYNYTLMGVSEDNWVHTMAMKLFTTTP